MLEIVFVKALSSSSLFFFLLYLRPHAWLSSSILLLRFFLFHSLPSFSFFQLRSEIDDIGRLLQEESLDLYPEMESRLRVLEQLRLIDKDTGVPTVKVRNRDYSYVRCTDTSHMDT